MNRRTARWVPRPIWLLWSAPVVVAALLLTHSVRVRSAPVARPRPTSAAQTSAPQASAGALLLDLEDDATVEDRARIAAALGRAIAPAPWPSARPAALGERLSAAAQLYRVEPPEDEVADVLAALAEEEDIEGVEREGVYTLPPDAARSASVRRSSEPPHRSLDGERLVPNDPYYRHQWHLDQVQMPEAWARTQGRGVVVAVIDTGVLFRDEGRFRRAPDLAQTRFVAGFDAVDEDRSPDDEHGHGTHVAGTVAQSTNNGVGVAGVAPQAAIMPVRVLDRNGAGRWGTVAAGIRWAADHGAHVINLSLGGSLPSQTIRRAVQHARKQGVVVVAAAGNAGKASVGYPAGHAGVLAVGAVRFDEALSFYSNYGKGLDLVAPGGDLRVDQNGDGLPDGVLQNTMVRGDPGRHDYLAFQGTSMAAPHVAGAAALLRAEGISHPGTIEALLERSAKDKRDRRRYGAGLLQVADALSLARRGLGGLRGLAAVVFGLIMLAGLRRSGRLDVSPPLALVTGAVVAGALGAVAELGRSFLGVDLGTWATGQGPILELAREAGASGGLGVLSGVLPLVAVALLLGVRRLRSALAGVCLGFAAVLAVEAILPTLHLAGGPWVVGPWLLCHAALALGLGRLVSIRSPAK